MSTASDSAIRVARKGKTCVRCLQPIAPRCRYLSYALGQRQQVVYCMRCAIDGFRDLPCVATGLLP